MDTIDNCKSYATQANLISALIKLGFGDDRFLMVCTSTGRFTAVFPVSNIQNGDMTRYARHGFMTLG